MQDVLADGSNGTQYQWSTYLQRCHCSSPSVVSITSTVAWLKALTIRPPTTGRRPRPGPLPAYFLHALERGRWLVEGGGLDGEGVPAPECYEPHADEERHPVPHGAMIAYGASHQMDGVLAPDRFFGSLKGGVREYCSEIASSRYSSRK